MSDERPSEPLLEVSLQVTRMLVKAAEKADWQQVIFNGGPPCFYLEGETFCLRAERWDGHKQVHPYLSLAELLGTLARSYELLTELANKVERLHNAANQ